jgi:hypothetical protein
MPDIKKTPHRAGKRQMPPASEAGKRRIHKAQVPDVPPGTSAPPSPARPASRCRVRLHDLRGVKSELGVLYRQAKTGRLDPATATKLAFLLNSIAAIVQSTELEQRISQLETRANAYDAQQIDRPTRQP